MEQLEEIRDRLNAATVGPWTQGRGVSPYVAKRDWVEVTNQAAICHDVRPADAEFIAHAPTDVARLLEASENVLERCEHMDRSKPVGDWCYNEITGAVARGLDGKP